MQDYFGENYNLEKSILALKVGTHFLLNEGHDCLVFLVKSKLIKTKEGRKFHLGQSRSLDPKIYSQCMVLFLDQVYEYNIKLH